MRHDRRVTEDGRVFHLKRPICPNVLNRENRVERNPAWVANEWIYATFAGAANLRMPEVRLLDYDGEKVFGSEVLPNREPLARRTDIRPLAERCGNREQLTRALLLDLALLNSDRELHNVLLDEGHRLWFFDHDKSLLGDGRRPGDLGRLDPGTLPRKEQAFFGDYLVSAECNSVVFTTENWEVLLRELRNLPLDLRHLDEAVRMMPHDWLTEEQQKAMRGFLPRWWEVVAMRFRNPDALPAITGWLTQRGFYR